MTQEALKALIHEMEYVLYCINEEKIPFDGDDFHEALRLGKKALAQPEQEPVGEVLNERGEVDWISFVPPVGTKLYTTPQRTWVGLTDEEIAKEFYKFEAAGAWYQFARAIEAKLKEKNT